MQLDVTVQKSRVNILIEDNCSLCVVSKRKLPRGEQKMALAFLVLFFFVSIRANEVTLGLSEEIYRKIPITRCCPDNEFYSLASGTCKTDDSIAYQWPPPVYSTRYNRTILAPNLRPFDLTERLDNCTGERGVFLNTKFTFYEDGTVLLADGTRLKSNEFCLNAIDTDAGEFVARHCARDPCNETNCVKKCCPIGMAMNATSSKCQTSALRFEVDFKNETGDSVRPEPFLIRDGGAPLCSEGMYALDPLLSPDDEFFILPDGRLYQPSLPEEERYTTAYCVENFLSDADTAVSPNQSELVSIKLIGTCFLLVR